MADRLRSEGPRENSEHNGGYRSQRRVSSVWRRRHPSGSHRKHGRADSDHDLERHGVELRKKLKNLSLSIHEAHR